MVERRRELSSRTALQQSTDQLKQLDEESLKNVIGGSYNPVDGIKGNSPTNDYHMRTYTLENSGTSDANPTSVYVCDWCENEFRTLDDVLTHLCQTHDIINPTRGADELIRWT
ncbi:MAG: hypothetical protein LBJ95_04590 [Oscillospiraceae bacterium]|nr:hypothetical protein [Oscillospiraceae bacterium]